MYHYTIGCIVSSLMCCHGDPCNTCTCTTRYYNQFIEVTNDCGKYNKNI